MYKSTSRGILSACLVITEGPTSRCIMLYTTLVHGEYNPIMCPRDHQLGVNSLNLLLPLYIFISDSTPSEPQQRVLTIIRVRHNVTQLAVQALHPSLSTCVIVT